MGTWAEHFHGPLAYIVCGLLVFGEAAVLLGFIIPGETACLACLIGDVPGPGMTETCDTAGVIGPAVNVVAALQVATALKFLSGQRELIEQALDALDEKFPAPVAAPVKDIEELFAPLRGLNLDFSRNPSTGRPVDL